jgi:hypothetical protein
MHLVRIAVALCVLALMVSGAGAMQVLDETQMQTTGADVVLDHVCDWVYCGWSPPNCPLVLNCTENPHDTSKCWKKVPHWDQQYSTGCGTEQAGYKCTFPLGQSFCAESRIGPKQMGSCPAAACDNGNITQICGHPSCKSEPMP